ncbi:hypothetical protein ACNOYE_35240 [Nannocystaceae bacterium ST9]
MFSSTLACDSELDPSFAADEIEVERSTSTGGSTGNPGWWLRVIEDEYELVTAEDLELQIVIDPATIPKDIAGVGEAQAMVMVDGPIGSALKIKLKIIVVPAGPPAEG